MRLNKRYNLKAVLDFATGLSVCVALATAGCDQPVAGKWQYKEIKRVKSPDSQVEAVLVEGDAGATTSTVYSIYLVASGSSIDASQRDQSIFDADHLKGFTITWQDTGLLAFQYEEARILGFRNFWYGRDVHNSRYVVELQLRPATTNYALPLKDRR